MITMSQCGHVKQTAFTDSRHIFHFNGPLVDNVENIFGVVIINFLFAVIDEINCIAWK
jgi:hypothetical protein